MHHNVSTTLSNTGTPVFFSIIGAIPAPSKFVQSIITTSAPSEMTSSAALAILVSATSPKLKLSVILKCLSETQTSSSCSKFFIILF